MSVTRTTALTGPKAVTLVVATALKADRFSDVAYVLGKVAAVAEGNMDSTEAYECLDGPGARNPELMADLAALITKHSA